MDFTRRAVLASVGGAGAVGTAGCLGGGGGGGDVPQYDCDPEPSGPADETPRPVIGDPDADVTVASFEDFACPHCATYKLEEFPEIRESYVDPGDVRYEHWGFPIPVDEEWSFRAASAARGVAARQGGEAFFEFATTAYEHQENYSENVVGYAAEEAGGDPCAAIADSKPAGDDPATVAYGNGLLNDRSEGQNRGISGTPTVFVDGESVNPTADAVGDAIEAALS